MSPNDAVGQRVINRHSRRKPGIPKAGGQPKVTWWYVLMSEPVVRICADQLRQVFELLIVHVARDNDDRLLISHDYFWSIPTRADTTFTTSRMHLRSGRFPSLGGNLQEMVGDPEKTLGYGLVWLADILHAIADESIG